MKYYVYIVKCKDNTLYCGYTTDLKRRLLEHNTSKKGAKYTRHRRPVSLVYSETYDTRSSAMSREYHIKQLSKKEKITLINENNKSI